MEKLRDILENIDIKSIESNINWEIDQRGIASVIEQNVIDVLTKTSLNVELSKSVKSMADITVNNIPIDIKSSDTSKKFKMPNLISIDVLRKKVLDKNISLIYLFVVYDSNQKKILNIFTRGITELNWDYLHIQNLGKGQLQIKNFQDFYNSLDKKSKLTENAWKDKLRNESINFYKKLEKKTEQRIAGWTTWEK
jgi:hypothetical protein|tara:strand:- start:49 stop:633 length:585 start_codon:yes stop_codon:yes gene_type:complete